MRVLPVDASALSTATPAALPIPAPRRESSIRMKKHPLNYVGYPAPLSVAEARARGATDYDIRSTRRFLPASWGIRFDDDSSTRFPVPTWADDKWVEEAQLLLAMSHRHPGIVACRETAARLYGWPLPRALDDATLHLGSADPNKRIRRSGIALHRLRNLSTIEWLKLPVLHPLPTFAQLAPLCSVTSLVQIGDAAVGDWKTPPQFSLTSLNEYVSDTKYLRSRSKLEAAAELIREDVDSPMETDLRLWLIARGLPEPIVHPAVYCPTTNLTLHPDLGYPEQMLALEYEGDFHRISEDQWATDIDRVNALRAAGWTVIRVAKWTDRRQLERDIRLHLGLNPK